MSGHHATTHDTTELTTAQDADEIGWLRADLAPADGRGTGTQDGTPPRRSPSRTGSSDTPGRGTCPPDTPRPARPVAPRKPVTYSARNNPSWTTDTSIRPSRS